MMTCDAVQDRLAELGSAAAKEDPALTAHLEDCADCLAIEAALQEVDAGLAGLGDQDAPDALVAKTLAAVRQAGPPAANAAKSSPSLGLRTFNRPWLAGAMAASLVALASAGLVGEMWRQSGFEDADPNFGLYANNERAAGTGGLSAVQKQVGAASQAPTAAPSPVTEHAEPLPAQSREQSKDKSDLLVGGKLSGEIVSEGAVNQDPDLTFGDGLADTAPLGRENRAIEETFRTGSRVGSLDYGSVQPERQFTEAPEFEAELEESNLADHRRRALSQDPSSSSQSQPGQSAFGQPADNEPTSNIVESIERDLVTTKPSTAPSSDQFGQTLDDIAAILPDEEGTEHGEQKALKGQSLKNEKTFDYFEKEAGQDRKEGAFKKNKAKESLAARLERKTESELGAGTSVLRSKVTGPSVGNDEDGRTRGDDMVSVDEPAEIAASEPMSQVAPSPVTADPATVGPATVGPARAFLRAIDNLEDLTYQSASGYWSNSYIPGDPAIRLLEARLREWNRTALGGDPRLERGAVKVAQPFDAPGDAAMALYLQADKKAVQGPTRLRLQIGLKGAERQGAHRPAMNVGLVFDLRHGADTDAARRLTALVSALQAAHQPGDRFSLAVAGPQGGLLIEPENFRHGPIKLALEQLFSETDADNASTGLIEALEQTSMVLRAGDRPESVLGSSLLILATSASLAGEMDELEALAHNNALQGLHLSVAALGGATDAEQIDRLVAAGQGNRRVLTSPDEATPLIDKELHAASRAVARALRLRIRLAPGVKLIDVLDSRRLGEPQAQAVRESEQSIDQRLARNLGIQADRGEDEEGIQIVIPNYFAGDEHVILLDLVTEGPGPLVDVTLRYKDLVTLGNGEAQASLSLGRSEARPGPLELNVLNNRVAWEVARQARAISRDLRIGDVVLARTRTEQLHNLIEGLRAEVPGWANDPALAADQAMLGEYLSVLASPALGDPVQRDHLADSLIYAAHRKLIAAAR